MPDISAISTTDKPTPKPPARMSTLRLTRCAVCVALMVAATLVRVQIPSLSVATTAQTYMVLLIGLILGAKDGAISVSLYMLLGLIGLPVFTRGGGFQTLFRAEGGYLIGFIGSAAVTGAISQSSANRRANAVWDVAAAAAGIVALYAVALPYIAVLQISMGSPIPAGKLMVAYGAVFWPLDAVKAALAVATARTLARAQPRLFGRR